MIAFAVPFLKIVVLLSMSIGLSLPLQVPMPSLRGITAGNDSVSQNECLRHSHRLGERSGAVYISAQCHGGLIGQ
jgi:hypothetical protein